MGVDRNLWLGAYLKINKSAEIEQEEEIVKLACKCDIGIGRSTKFCSMCGKPVKIEKKKKKVALNPWDLLEQIGDGLTIAGEDQPLLLPNRKTKYGLSIDVGYDDSKYGTFVEPEKAIEEFNKTYKKELEKLDKLGVEYEILSGFVFYYS